MPFFLILMINLKLEDIKLIYKSADNNTKGYIIEFNDGKKIHLTKRRTIIALLKQLVIAIELN